MTNDEFEKLYPRENFQYVRTGTRTKGHMEQTEIEYYDIINKANGELVHKATYIEHTNIRGLDTSSRWE